MKEAEGYVSEYERTVHGMSGKTNDSLNWRRKLTNGEPVTVVALGDSWTYGSVADGWYEARESGMNTDLIHGSWVMQLRRRLQQLNPQAVVVNSGKGGWTAPQALEAFDALVTAHQPDLLLLNYGINDWKRPIPLERYRADMERILDKAGELGSASVLWTSGPVSALSGETYGWHSPMKDDGFPEPFARFNDTLRELAAERGLPLADAERWIEAEWREGTDISSWFYDSIHFLQIGHDRIFACICETLDI
ncbi:SGNH/GDSL hydrolase family protein [Paenibacillus sp. GCM10012303]|uniref:SGNH/GDSL hydrolase family protein n=1 Tax=Paenibacillus sp. GCM10012303 TaxID=3317340 RepID=UPI0036D22C8E